MQKNSGKPRKLEHDNETSNEPAEVAIANDDRPAISPHVGLFARLKHDLKKHCKLNKNK